jgi:cytidylate kinase
VRVVAIDGPAGSGKSTVARAVAARLGLDYLDTGAMYRSVALAVLRQGIDPGDAEAVAAVAVNVEVELGDAIRTSEVNAVVSLVAANPAVRKELVRRQQQWIRDHGGGVVEGRDIGTVVAPDAELKVYLTASEEERARRRHEEPDPGARDRLDSSRPVSPLYAADDALVIDTTDRSVEEIVEEVLSKL